MNDVLRLKLSQLKRAKVLIELYEKKVSGLEFDIQISNSCDESYYIKTQAKIDRLNIIVGKFIMVRYDLIKQIEELSK